MTLTGLDYDPTRPDDVVLTIDGHDYYATGWAIGLDQIPAPGHRDGCWSGSKGFPVEVCPTCQPPL
jgi:hypothetical protein